MDAKRKKRMLAKDILEALLESESDLSSLSDKDSVAYEKQQECQLRTLLTKYSQ